MIEDNIRPELTWYVFGGPGDRYSLQATSDKVALISMLFASPQGMMVMYQPEDCIVAPIALDSDCDNKWKDIFGDPITDWIDSHLKEIYDVMKTCMIGEPKEREKLTKRLEEFEVNSIFDIEDVDLRDSIVEKYKDDIQTSVYDLHPRINGALKALYKKMHATTE